MSRCLFIMLALFSLLSCSKDDLPDDVIGTPEFVSNLFIDGEQVDFVAGINGLQLFSNVADSDSVIVFSSGYQQQDCDACPPNIALSLYSPKDFVWDASTDWESELQSWDLALQIEAEGNDELFVSLDPGNPQALGYWFINGQQKNPTPTNTFTAPIDGPGDYTILFQDSTGNCANGPASSLSWDGLTAPCYGFIATEDNFNYVVTPSNPNDPLQSFVWILNGDTLDSDSNSVAINVFQGTLCVNYESSTCAFENCVQLSPVPSLCVANSLIIGDSIVTGSSVDNIALVDLDYTDPTGITYTTEGDQQVSQIALASISPYQEPTSPELTLLKATYQLSCTLYSSAGNTLNLEGRIEVAWQLPE